MQTLFQARLAGLLPLAACSLVGLTVLLLVGPWLWRALRLDARTRPVQRSMLTDLGYMVLGPVTETLTRALTTLGFVLGALLLGVEASPDLLDGFGPVTQQPRWLVVGEMLVLGDFIYYWTHRLAHEVPWLWRLHAVHHSTRHMRWSSALRSHPGEAYVIFVNHVPLFLLGFPIDALVAIAPLATLYAMFIHSQLPLGFRRLSYLLNSPRFHAWHHARDVRSGTKNYAGLFPVFDALFGTYQVPADAPPETGVDDPDMPEGFFAQLAYPLRFGAGQAREHEPRPVRAQQGEAALRR